MKQRYAIRLLLGLLIAPCLTGCLTPLRNSQPVFSSKSVAPANALSSATSDSIVRGQGPNEYFGGRPRQSAQVAPAQSQYNPNYYPRNTAQSAGYQQPIGQPNQRQIQPVQYTSPDALWGMAAPSAAPAAASPYASAPVIGQPAFGAPSAASTVPPATFPGQAEGLWGSPTASGPLNQGTFGTPVGPPGPTGVMGLPTNFADVVVNVQETQTGKFMVGAAVNSDAGVTGQIVIDERNFDWRAFPRSWDDVVSGGAFRGAGQGLRIEALPGSQVQRYMVQFTEPYLFDTRISMNLSAYLYDRQFFDWDEQRLGGRFGLGYRVTPDMSLSASLRAEQVELSNVRRVSNVIPTPQIPDPDFVGDPADAPQIDDPTFPTFLPHSALADFQGEQDLFSGRFSLIQDTRDIPFQPTQGYYFEAAFEQTFGTYDYSRFDLDLRRYFLLAERPDGSGRHVLGFSNKLGISGSDTPVFENYFAGGYSTMRGFDFRRASPMANDMQPDPANPGSFIDTGSAVTVGGRLQFLGSAEYLFPITADDMIKGVAFVDYGTVEEDIKIEAEDFRVAVGFGLRVNIPAMGPAPIALDFAVPIAREESDEIRGFSFFMGTSR